MPGVCHRAHDRAGQDAPRRLGETSRRSASIRAAVASSGGSSVCWTASARRAAGVRGDVDGGDDAAAAVADRRGDRAQPLLELLVDERPALARGRGRARRAARPASSIACAVSGRELGAGEVGVELVVAQRREQHAAHRGRVGGEARADVDRDAHDPATSGRGRRRRSRRRRAPRPSDDSRTSAASRSRCGSATSGRRQARQVRVAEVEHARRERELLAVGADVAEVGEREQEAARGGAREAGAAGDVGQRQLGVVGAEGADHRRGRARATGRSARRAPSQLLERLLGDRDGAVGRRARRRRPRCGSAPRGSPRA